jgi:hypothetical protein
MRFSDEYRDQVHSEEDAALLCDGMSGYIGLPSQLSADHYILECPSIYWVMHTLRRVASVETSALILIFPTAPSSLGARAMPTQSIDAQEERILALAAEQVDLARGRTAFRMTHRQCVNRANPLQGFAWSAISGSVQH